MSSEGRNQVFKLAVALTTIASACSGVPTVARACSLDITSPIGGAQVNIQDIVDGTASNIPAGTFVWVLARIRGISGWFPQGSGPVTQNGTSWTVFVTYGIPSDTTKEFEVMAGVFDGAGNGSL